MLDPTIRHQAFVQRLAAGISKRVVPLLIAGNIEAKALVSAGANQFEVQEQLNESFNVFEAALVAELGAFLVYEAGFAHRLLDNAVNQPVVLPNRRAIDALLTESVLELVEGRTIRRATLNQLIVEFANNKSGEVRRALLNSQGKTVQQLTKEVGQIVETRTRQQAKSLVITATNHMGTVARSLTFNENSELLSGEEYVATLDSRTTVTCATLDNNVYPVGQGVFPPQHWRCRSVRVPVIKPEFSILKPTQRASKDGPVSANLGFSGWLRKQPHDVQNEILGAERAKLFRAKKWSVKRFADDDGVVYTLDQLAAREGLTLQ